MEGDRARQLTTRLVAVGLGLGMLCLAVGVVLGLLSGGPQDRPVLPYRELPAGLVAGDPLAWQSLGALLLILTPSLRLIGMTLTFHAEEDRRALLSAGVLVVALLGVLIGAAVMFQG